MKIIEDVCQGLRYLAFLGIVHRDIKPANILKGKDGNWKIADFGFSIDISDVQNEKKLSIGTPVYMAPEVIKSGIYSFQSDIFALGIMIYRLLHDGNYLWFEANKKKILKLMLNCDVSEIELPYPFNTQFFQ